MGNLGAAITIANTSTVAETSGDAEAAGSSQSSGSQSSSQNAVGSSSKTTVLEKANSEVYSSGMGPLLGLMGTTDSRLNTITLVGDQRLISVAESYLKQIDLRKRQVAVKVQILNVDLTNDRTIDSSFSARIGNSFIVSENGQAYMNFGKLKPEIFRARVLVGRF